MAQIRVTGSVRQRGSQSRSVDISIEVDERMTPQQQYDEVIQRLVDDNLLGLSSGIHIFKDLIIPITRSV
jgi:hypothetical protein